MFKLVSNLLRLFERMWVTTSVCDSGYMPKDIEEWYENLLKISKGNARLRYIELDPLTITPVLRSNF